MLRRYFSVIVVALVMICCVSSAYAASYQVVDLGSLSIGWDEANAINDSGQIFGWPNGNVSTLRNGRSTTLLENAVPMAANNNGTVVGYRSSPDFSTYGAIVLNKGVVTEIPPLPGWPCNMATGINNSGMVCGYANGLRVDNGWTSGGGFVWKDGVLRSLDPDPIQVFAYGINDAGQVVGYCRGHAFVWQNGEMRFIETLPDIYGGAGLAINNRGDIAGYVDLKSYQTHPCVWINGVQQDLGLLPGTEIGRACAINERGVVAGNLGVNGSIGGIGAVAFVWQDGVMQALPSLGGETYVNGMNNRGQMVGWSITADGARHGVLWEPIPSGKQGRK